MFKILSYSSMRTVVFEKKNMENSFRENFPKHIGKLSIIFLNWFLLLITVLIKDNVFTWVLMNNRLLARHYYRLFIENCYFPGKFPDIFTGIKNSPFLTKRIGTCFKKNWTTWIKRIFTNCINSDLDKYCSAIWKYNSYFINNQS